MNGVSLKVPFFLVFADYAKQFPEDRTTTTSDQTPVPVFSMVLFEDQECGVCYLHYSRIDRVPRTLHCNHTFCTPCLETMGLRYSGLRTIRCPLCRQVTCVDRGLSLQEALFVNSQLWDNICDEQEEEEDEREQGKNTNMQVLPSSQAEW